MAGALLRPVEVGNGFAQRPYTPPSPSDHRTTLACGQVNPAAVFPNALRVGVDLEQGKTAYVQQGVVKYFDEETTVRAFEYYASGFSCVQGDGADFSKAADVSDDFDADRGLSWQVTDDQGETGIIILLAEGRITAGFTFLTGPGVDRATVKDPVEVAKVAWKRQLDQL